MGKVSELQNRISLPTSASADEYREFLGRKPSSISKRKALPTSKLCWRTILDKPCGDPYNGTLGSGIGHRFEAFANPEPVLAMAA
jgi:hypothetical protein